MTIRDIVVAFGFEVDRASERQAENSIRGIKNMAAKLLGAIGIGLSIAGIAGLAEAAADADALKSQFEQVFGEVQDEAADKLQAIADDTGVMVNRMKGSFAQIAAFSKTTGATTAEALDIADRSMAAVTDSAAFYDRSIEEMTNSLQSFLKGNFENDAALGISCTETTRNAAANELYSKSFRDLSEAEKQLTLLKMVEDGNKLSGALGQAARESDTWTNQLGNLKQSIRDLKAAAGGAFLKPAVMVLKTLVLLVQGLTQKIQVLTGETGMVTRAYDRFHALIKRLKPEISRMAETLQGGIRRGIRVVNTIVGRLGGMENALKILAVLAGAFFLALNWGKVAGAAGAVFKLFGFLGKVFSLVALKVLAVVAVVAVLALAVEDFIQFLLGNDSVIGTIFDKAGIGADHARQAIVNAWGKVKGFLLDVWDVLKTAAGMYVNTVRAFFERHSESIRANVERVWGIIRTFLNGVWSFLSQLAATLFGNTEKNIDGSTKSTKDKLLEAWQEALDALSAVWDAIYGAASAVFNAMASLVEFWFVCVQTFWAKWGQQVLAWFKTVWDTLGSMLGHFLDVVKGVANFIEAVFTGDWAGAWEAVKQILVSNWGMMEDFLAAAWETIKLLFAIGIDTLTGLWEKFWAACAAVLMMAWEAILSALAGAKEAVIQVFLDILSGATSKVAEIRTAVVDGFQAAIDWIKGLPPQAVQWGADFIGGLKEGILSGVRGIEEAVKGVGDKIRSYLHFSVPDVGPLTDYERWMPDFMGGLAEGIAGNEGLVLDRVRGLAGGIRVLMSAATANAATAAIGAVSSRSSSVVQNVNIDNTYNGGSREAQGNVARAMRKSAEDATGYMARGLAYARG